MNIEKETKLINKVVIPHIPNIYKKMREEEQLSEKEKQILRLFWKYQNKQRINSNKLYAPSYYYGHPEFEKYSLVNNNRNNNTLNFVELSEANLLYEKKRADQKQKALSELKQSENQDINLDFLMELVNLNNNSTRDNNSTRGGKKKTTKKKKTKMLACRKGGKAHKHRSARTKKACKGVR